MCILEDQWSGIDYGPFVLHFINKVRISNHLSEEAAQDGLMPH